MGATWMGTEYRCKVCSYVSHRKCAHEVMIPCRPSQTAGFIPGKLYADEDDQLEKGYHMFLWKNFKHPTFCNWCRKFLVGLVKQGLRCKRCKLVLHSDCLKDYSHAPTCLSSFVRPEDPQITGHHWIEGNNPSACAVCRVGQFTPQFLTGFTCSRCHSTVHNSCRKVFEINTPECSLGQFRKFIVPPSGFVLLPDNTFKLNVGQDVCPLVVFVNKKSGGQQGLALIRRLKSVLNPLQVFDLSKGGPKPGLELFKDLKNWWILACGGDGTVGWVLSVLDTMGLADQPPVGVLPLGTGNDLARTLHWGPGYTGEKVKKILKPLDSASVIYMDRWKLDIEDMEGNIIKSQVMNNYFSIGIDAKVALAFHQERETNPHKFNSRTGNKIMYGKLALDEYFKTCRPIKEIVSIESDGGILPVEKDIYGIIILNLPSYAGGVNLWGNDNTQRIDDKLLEVVGVHGLFHMGQCQIKASSGRRFGQSNALTFTFLTDGYLAVQIDGEPWEQGRCKIHISLLNQVKMLCRKPTILIP
eukprot:TRINITY_DN1547_c0_g1_i2.p1 TRINITY_DN1547_c0_g1~~TRINITY_DN1547_c0_g1_i2.p1  ORF type:complete len:527 (-),score=67.19 TRINITY_DN1547_c0_g1_i2:76-1656(-)